MTDLRQKARLLVHEGATLVGVMNEFNVLEEDEVFVQVSNLYNTFVYHRLSTRLPVSAHNSLSCAISTYEASGVGMSVKAL